MEDLVIRGPALGEGGGGRKRPRDDDDDPRKNERKQRLEEEAIKLRRAKKAKIAEVRRRYGELLLAVNGNHDIAMNLLEFEYTRKEIEDANLRARD